MRKQPRLFVVFAVFSLAATFVAADAVTTTDSASALPRHHRRYRRARVKAAPTPGNLLRLRQCESGDDYTINTGNGYYGAYQFSPSTWHSLGLSGLPHEADPATQDAAVVMLQSRVGWTPWPVCSRRLAA